MTAIVLVNYNNKFDTIDCLNSIKKSIEIELPYVVVVDNNSTNILNKSDLAFYPNLKIIYNKENIGFGKANNLGIDWVLNNLKTDYIFLLNNDTIIQPNSIKTLTDVFHKDDKTVLVTPKILTYENEPRIWYAGGSFNHFKMSVSIKEYGQPNKEMKSCYTEFASGCAMFFKTEYFESNDVFDPNFFMYDEDVDLCIRIKKQGNKIFFTNESIIFHKCQGSQKENLKKDMNQLNPNNPNWKFYLSHTIPNRFYIIDKHFFYLDKVKKKIVLTIYWLTKALQYLILGRTKMMTLTIKLIVKSYIRPSKNII